MKKNFKKSDLKTGMLCETEDGYLRLVIGESLVSCESGGGIRLGRLDDDLIEKTGSNPHMVMKVYSEPASESGFGADLRFWLSDKYFLEHCKLLWERQQEPTLITYKEVDYSKSTIISMIEKAIK